MDHSVNPFQKAGLALLIMGAIDIGFMGYCIANKISYSSSLNIFAVIAGIFLMRGSVKTARTVRWFSAFAVVAFTLLILSTPFVTPISLLTIQIELNYFSILVSFIFGLLTICILTWVHLQLSRPESLNLLANAGYKTGKPKSAYIAGIALLTIATGVSIATLNGESAQKAKSLAQTQLGSEYQYHVSRLSIFGNSGHASVIAYNSKEIRSVDVHW